MIRPKDPERAARLDREWRERSVERYLERLRERVRNGEPFARLERTTEMPEVNKERRAKRVEADEVYGSHHRWCMTRPCDLRFKQQRIECASYGDRAPIEGHHLKTVGSGGKDRNNQISACNAHHDHLHQLGSVSAGSDFYGIDLRSLACEVTAEFDREHQPEPAA